MLQKGIYHTEVRDTTGRNVLLEQIWYVKERYATMRQKIYRKNSCDAMRTDDVPQSYYVMRTCAVPLGQIWHYKGRQVA